MIVLMMEGYGLKKGSRVWEKLRGLWREKEKSGRACFLRSSNRTNSPTLKIRFVRFFPISVGCNFYLEIRRDNFK